MGDLSNNASQAWKPSNHALRRLLGTCRGAADDVESLDSPAKLDSSTVNAGCGYMMAQSLTFWVGSSSNDHLPLLS